ncbi:MULTISPECIES: TetR family transcriptional regulator [Leeia]|uniref:TetR/AcrR family transcriptional regulator n=1 Tax=Leeia aquatica TaxID=2725557 RepID=A0A847S8K7_9NEIS|nr:TetR family transcriptional regulator [Leeia aquatica]NLR73946.1 TetR/AcrR family transcriptional regulator [Leeia aquatica]
MASKPFKRARDAESKHERRRSILDAALQLFQGGNLLPRVDDIALASKLAKGTVYLYFESREEIYLTLVEEHFTAQLQALEAYLAQTQRITADELSEWILAYQLEHPAFLPMACIVSSVLEQNVGSPAAARFKRMLAEKLVTCGRLLDQHLADLPKDEGYHLLMAIYSLLMGLWQNAHPPKALRDLLELLDLQALLLDFQAEARRSLLALCRGYTLSR